MDLLREDTIVAVATPRGRGGLGIVRVSGPRTADIVGRCFEASGNKTGWPPESHRAVHGVLRHPTSREMLDEVVVCYFRAPHSYTREDVAEIGAHGGPVVLDALVAALAAAGARAAEPGEFTLRAFLSGRLDLSQAEAVADLIDARTGAAHRHALHQLGGGLRQRIAALREGMTNLMAHIEAWLDFPDEDIEPLALEGILSSCDVLITETRQLAAGAARRKACEGGIRTALVGRPNVGKSSLFNAILGMERVLVSPTPGTTRDVVEATVDIGGYAFLLADTAGLGDARDELDARGMGLSREWMERADVVVLVVEAATGLTDADRALLGLATASKARVVLCMNKSDAGDAGAEFGANGIEVVHTSAIRPDGVVPLLDALGKLADDDLQEAIAEGALVNPRQADALNGAADALAAARRILGTGPDLEIAAVEVRAAVRALAQVDGEGADPDLLGIIFSRFCIGK